MIEVWFDGCCEPINPGGYAGYGAAIYRGGELLHEISGFLPKGRRTSNNVAEYQAFTQALDWIATEIGTDEPVLFRGDSKLVIEQMFGTWRIKAGFYVPLALAARQKLKRFRSVSGRWVPRDQNGNADRLSKAELIRRGVRFKIQPEEAADA